MAEWKHTLYIGDVFHNDEMDLSAKGQVIVDRIQNSSFWHSEDDGDLEQIVEELEDAAKEDDERWFNYVWSAFYDWADANRVWIDTWKKREVE